MKLRTASIATVFALALVVSGCGKSSSSGTTSTTGDGTATTAKSGGSKFSLAGLLKTGSGKRCTASVSSGGQTYSSTIYTDGKDKSAYQGKITGENGGEVNMIYTPDKAYMWFTGNGQTAGYSFDPKDKNFKDSDLVKQGGLDPDKDIDGTCTSWSVDSSKFEQPSGVQFTDLSQMLSGLGQ